ncbi:hypothetical protein BGZ61DRAFT_396582 [Ilyonectria robusta]|uniref:uncharacterized protein n=1 Tax=Ilyonectria robusta TaxID=1079257 RepID=UPI001E8DCC8D|nr:uncharacterized protein BGZ61DRAFT_396582 [Ilyonectria robusta]KAH8676982.1 hypothetical protein BGZ61DRAFT_396582 [Ilyonectria robusta]
MNGRVSKTRVSRTSTKMEFSLGNLREAFQGGEDKEQATQVATSQLERQPLGAALVWTHKPTEANDRVSAWLESSGTDHRKRRWSDSRVYRSNDEPPSNISTKSALEIDVAWDREGFAEPIAPTSEPSLLSEVDTMPSTTVASNNSSTKHSSYRVKNLRSNKITLRHPLDQLPENVQKIVHDISTDGEWEGPSIDDLKSDYEFHHLQSGRAESKVTSYWRRMVFLEPGSREKIESCSNIPMKTHCVPCIGEHRISTPVPDILYGYSYLNAFPDEQMDQFVGMGSEMVVNSSNLAYPFFLVEAKGDNSSGDALWCAVNQCLGGSASCVKVAESLNRRLREHNIDQIETVTFSVAINATEARLFVCWEHDHDSYYMRSIGGFLLYDPEHFLSFRNRVLNILRWGEGKRLEGIQHSLEQLLEAEREEGS